MSEYDSRSFEHGTSPGTQLPTPVTTDRLGLDRPRLHRLVGPAPILVVHGAAGCGKTTFLRQHAARWPGEVAWLQCDGLDRSADTFARRVAAALGRPDCPLDDAASAMSGQLLVIDELDKIAGSSSAMVLDALVSRLPDGNAIALGTRGVDVLTDLERWRLSTELTCVSGHDLRFRLWEVERLFREIYRQNLAVDEVHGVSCASGGWPVALHYFGVRLRQSTTVDRHHLIATLGRSNLQLRRYLRSQVLASLSTTDRQALRRLAVFDRVDVDRTRLFAPDAEQALLGLVNIGVLEETPDDRTFRMHSLLRAELLDELVAGLSNREVHDLYLEAAQVLEAVGEPHEASLARARAGHSGPGAPATDASALLGAASRHVVAGELEAAREDLAAAVVLFDQEGGNQRARRQLRLLNDWLEPPRGDPTSWVAALRMTLEGRRTTWSGACSYIVVATRSMLAGDLPGAQSSFAAAEQQTHDGRIVVVSMLGAGVCALLDGRPRDAADLGERAWSWCRDDGSDALALIAEALMLARDGSPDDLETVAKLAANSDAIVAALLHLIVGASYGRDAPAAVDHRRRAAESLDEAGLTAFARATLIPRGAVRQTVRSTPEEASRTTTAALRLECLGGFNVFLEEVEFDSTTLRPKHRELLALLSSRPKMPYHREELMEALWPDSSVEAARRGLHTAISAIRRWLTDQGDERGRSRIARSGDSYALDIEANDTDLGRLLAACDDARLALQHGDLSLTGLRIVVDAYHDEPYRSFGPVEWAVRARRATHAQVRDVISSLASAGRGDGAHDEWASLLRRAATVLPDTAASLGIPAGLPA